jgi:hypothetical protein
MRLRDPKLDAMRTKRLQAAADIDDVGRKLLSQSGRIKVYDNEEYDSDWPVDWPIPSAVADAVQSAADAAYAVEAAITAAKAAYRQKVLAWLLAETETQLRVQP